MHLSSLFVYLTAVSTIIAHVASASSRIIPAASMNLTSFECGTHKSDASAELLLAHRVLRESEDRQVRNAQVIRRQTARIIVDLYVHLIYSSSKTYSIPIMMWQAQVAAINQAFKASGFIFRLVALDKTVNDNWAQGNDVANMQASLRRGTYGSLNVFFLTDLGRGLIGQCSMPYNVAPNSPSWAYASDSCLVHAATMPGGAFASYNQGKTAVHEIGHWLGMFHVFEGYSCTGSGDEIFDTPAQRTSSVGCPSMKDSCPDSPGYDSINNYMDYSTDPCYTMFTSGQIIRMRELWYLWRKDK